MSLGRKLARLSGFATGSAPGVSGAPPPRPSAEPKPPLAPIPPAFEAPREPLSATTLLDDLRAKMDAILSRNAVKRAPAAAEGPDLPFVTVDTPLGPLHRRVLRLPASHRVGRVSVLPSLDADPTLLALLALDPSLSQTAPEGALYLDTETTGLAGGAGTVAFLVGLAFWDRSTGHAELVVEQFLVRMLGEEAPMLEAVKARIAAATMLVTFNGKSFDMPLLRTRFVLARTEAPVEPPHLDLLHVARRIHKRSGLTCRLVALEDSLLGFVRIGDIPSGDVSACYLHFLRTGATEALLGVVEHNLHDVVTMASLLGLYGEPLESSELTGAALAGASRVLRRAGATVAAREFAEASVGKGGGADAFRARAEIAKVLGDRDRAIVDLHAVLEAEDDPNARLELAKLYEHHKKDLARALELVDAGTGEAEEARSKRKRRLTSKLERHATKAAESAPLFAKRAKPA